MAKFRVGDLIRHREGRLRYIKEIVGENYNCPIFKYRHETDESIYPIGYIHSRYTIVTEEERAGLL